MPKQNNNPWADTPEERKSRAKARLQKWIIEGRVRPKERLTSLDQLPDNPPKWLVDQIIPARSLVFISAPAKSGKSFLSLHLALSLARGKEFLGEFEITTQTPVIYYCLEDNPREVKARAKNFLGGESLPNNVFVFSPHVSLNLKEDFAAIEDDVKNKKSKVIIIDTFRRASLVDENESKEVAEIFAIVRALITKLKIAIILIHHTGHGKKSVYDSSTWLRGSTDLAASFDALIALTSVSKKKGRVNVKVFHRFRNDLGFSYGIEKAKERDERTNDRPITGLRFLKYAKWSMPIKKAKKFQESKVTSWKEKESKKLIIICAALDSLEDKKSEIKNLAAMTKMPRSTLSKKLKKLEHYNPKIVTELKERGKHKNSHVVQLVEPGYEALLLKA